MLEFSGYTVEEAAGGDECVRRARELRPALIVLDLHMPGSDGFSAARALRADPITHATPILAVSGASLPKEIDRARTAGCDVVLNKPLSPRDFLRAVRALLSSARLERIQETAELQRRTSSGLLRQSFPDLRALYALGPGATGTEIRQLMQGTQVTICSFCSRVRFPGEWRAITPEMMEFFQSWSTLSHAICPECLAREYPEVGDRD